MICLGGSLPCGCRRLLPLVVCALLTAAQSHTDERFLRARDTCTADTWGLANDRPPETLFERVRPADLTCSFTKSDPSDREKFVLNWYQDSAKFQAWKGVDLVPSRHWEYDLPDVGKFFKANVKNWTKATAPPFHKISDLAIQECEIPQADGSFYRVQRLGPFTSTGGYDYWQVGWMDAWRLSEVLPQHPQGIMVSSAFSAPVLADGSPIGFPPIHIHHIHIGPTSMVASKAKGNSLPILVVEQHGDYECTQSDGGLDCLFERTPDGYAKSVNYELSLEGELNDVRPAGSEPMTWWYQVVLHYRPKPSGLRPMSQFFIVGPGPATDEQLSTVSAFPVPTEGSSVYWYTGRMPSGGSLLRNKLHSHNTLFDRAFFFHASPQQLGLDSPEFKLLSPKEGCWSYFEAFDAPTGEKEISSPGCLPVLLRDTGHKDFDSLEAFLYKNLDLAADDHMKGCLSAGKSVKCKRQRPQLVCQSHGNYESILDKASGRDFKYDRRSPSCCRPWDFYEDDVFTVVGFMQGTTQPFGPWAPTTVPKYVPMHVHWVMSFDTHDSLSHYAMGRFTTGTDVSSRKEEAEMPKERTKLRRAPKLALAQTGKALHVPAASLQGPLSGQRRFIGPGPGAERQDGTETFGALNTARAQQVLSCLLVFALGIACGCCWLRRSAKTGQDELGSGGAVRCVIHAPCCPPVMKCMHAQRDD